MMNAKNSAEYVELKRSIYREYSRSYDEDRQRFVSPEALLQRIRWALEPLEPGDNLLDLGCGSGELLLEAHRKTGGAGVLAGLDLSPDMLSLARVRAGAVASLIQGNSLDGLPFSGGNIHLVTSLNLLQELPAKSIPSLLEQVHRVLRPGGCFRAVIPCMADRSPSSQAFQELAQERGAMRFWWPEELEALLANVPGFTQKEFRVAASTAASAAAKGKTSFKFFTGLVEEVRNQGLDPEQVEQSVLFFSARRSMEKLDMGHRSIEEVRG
jgi:ubiquinone/menaquinone biosynthesis C-methylase UbiE